MTVPAPCTLTLAIPVYNGATRLPALFDRLRSQHIPPDLGWEIVIVDNNSQDDTAAVVATFQASDPPCPVRYEHEPRQGAAFARLRAIAVARGEWVGFLDDDNWPEPDWIAQAWDFGRSHPQAGAFAGKVLGDYERQPPAGFERLEGFLAVRDYADYGDRAQPFDPVNLRLPPAAALMVRRSAWLAAVPPEPTLSGKVPGRLVQGDDYEPLLHIHKAGWEIWYCPAMRTHHQMPAWRLERAYLLELARGCGLATYALRSINTPPNRRWPLFGRTVLGNVRKAIATQFGWQRDPQPPSTAHAAAPPPPEPDAQTRQLIAEVETAFFWSCALSPFYALGLACKRPQRSVAAINNRSLIVKPRCDSRSGDL